MNVSARRSSFAITLFVSLGAVALAQTTNTFFTRELEAQFSVGTGAINALTVTEVFLPSDQILEPGDGFLVSISDFGQENTWIGSLSAGFTNTGTDPVSFDRSSSLGVQIRAADGTLLSSRGNSSTPFTNPVTIAPGDTYFDTFSFGGGSGSGPLSPQLLPYFNQVATTPFTVRVSGVNVGLPSGVEVTSTEGAISGTTTLTGTLRYFNDFIWQRSDGGDLSANSSWRAGDVNPGGAGTHVAFGRAITQDSAVRLTDFVTLGKLYFDNPAHRYEITSAAPGQTLALTAEEAEDRGIEVRSGSHRISVPLRITDGGSEFFGPVGTSFYLFDGTTLEISGGISGGGNVFKGGDGVLEFNTTASNAAAPDAIALYVADGLARFRGIGHTGNVLADIGESTPGTLSGGIVEFALERDVSFTGAYLRANYGFFGSATGGVLRVVSDAGRGHTLTLGGTTNSTYQGGTDLLSGHLSVGLDASLGTGALRVNPAAADQAGLSAGGGTRTLTNAIQLLAHDLTLQGTHELRLNGAISGPGALVKTDSGRARLSGNNTFTGGVDIRGGTLEAASNNALGTGTVNVRSTGTLAINHGVTIANRINVFSGATLQLAGVAQDIALEGGTVGGTGRINGTVGGGGVISPGNSEGILTLGAIDPSEGMDFVFRLTATAPDFATPAASLNDVLLLTDSEAPFAAPLGAQNTVRIYLSAELFASDHAVGGFVTTLSDTASLLTWIEAGAFEFYLESIGGSFAFEERSYVRLGSEFVAVSTQTVLLPEGDGAALRLDFAPIPEPAHAGLLLGAAALSLGFGTRRRRRSS